MRLLRVDSDGQLSMTRDQATPFHPYAILSHTWAKDDQDEVTFDDIQQGTGISKPGYAKLQFCASQVRKNGLEHFWIDTCCINKQSSAELSEAINSMYAWYGNAKICYVYLDDVDKSSAKTSFPKGRWFTRGWTLQELLAPKKIVFYDRTWRRLGNKNTLARRISTTTRIPVKVLTSGNLAGYCIAQKMSWAAGRVTTRVEDRAYCLLGLFGVNIALIYGEGQRAFIRLQEEIVRSNDDHSIFAWSMQDIDVSGLFAPSPDYFSRCHAVSSYESSREPFALTNRGLAICLTITPWLADTYLVYLDCTDRVLGQNTAGLGIWLRRLLLDDQYARINLEPDGISRGNRPDSRPTEERQLYIRQDQNISRNKMCLYHPVYGFRISRECALQSMWIYPRNPTDDPYSAILHAGQSGHVMVLDFAKLNCGLMQVALGFDFDFNPICLLREYDAPECPDFVQDHPDEWCHLYTDITSRDKVVEESKVYRRHDSNGLWNLAGHRLRGLDVCLYREITAYNGSMLRLTRDTSMVRSHWVFSIDNLDVSFGAPLFGLDSLGLEGSHDG